MAKIEATVRSTDTVVREPTTDIGISSETAMSAVTVALFSTLTLLFRGVALALVSFAPFNPISIKMALWSITALKIGQICGAIFSAWHLLYNLFGREEPLDATHQIGVALAGVNCLGNVAYLASKFFPLQVPFLSIAPLFDAAYVAGNILCAGTTWLVAGEFVKEPPREDIREVRKA